MRQSIQIVFCLALLLVRLSAANGLTVQLQGANMGELPEIQYQVGSGSPLEIILELANESGIDSLPVVAWQIGLSISPDATSEGDIAFESVFLPAGSLFGSNSEPIALGELPADVAIVSDFDPNEGGVAIPAESAAPIVGLTLLPNNDSIGDFVLSMAAFDLDDLDRTSYWADAIDFDFTPFDNPTTAGGLIELAIIHLVDSQSSNGDYNNDLIVDAADYTVWRDGLGSVFTEEDYGIWKQHFGESLPVAASTAAAPEPSSAWLISIGLLLHFITRGAVSEAVRSLAS